MPSEALPTTVRDFLRVHIQSVAQLEILSLVSATPAHEWTAVAVDHVLRSNVEAIARWLAEFARGGLLTEHAGPPTTYRYEPRTPELATGTAETVQAFRLRPVPVIEAIFKPDHAAQSFADAFRIRSH
jgi:hypothetical protein